MLKRLHWFVQPWISRCLLRGRTWRDQCSGGFGDMWKGQLKSDFEGIKAANFNLSNLEIMASTWLYTEERYEIDHVNIPLLQNTCEARSGSVDKLQNTNIFLFVIPAYHGCSHLSRIHRRWVSERFVVRVLRWCCGGEFLSFATKVFFSNIYFHVCWKKRKAQDFFNVFL